MNTIKKIFNQKKILISLFSLVILLLNLSTAYAAKKAQEDAFKLSPDDFKGLNLNEKEAQELEKFVSELNQMDPKELAALEEISKQVEAEMKAKKLDPNNPEDIFKWIDEESKKEAEKKPAKHDEPKLEDYFNNQDSEISPKLEPEKELAQKALSQDIKKTIEEILRDLSKVRQKAQNYKDLKKKLNRWEQELTRLTFYLNILLQPDLLKHLTSDNFKNLSKSLEKLHNTLIKNEPNFKTKKESSDEEDPYEILGISYDASLKDIKAAYLNLKKTIHPSVISKNLKELDIPQKDRKRKIKEAKLAFSFVEGAYNKLKDKKNRDMTDKLLEDKISKLEKSTESSKKAFDKIINQISNSIYQDDILSDIEKLLEKYKPEELEKAKKQIELEKKVFERSKEEKRVTPSTDRGYYQPPQEEPYAEFYRQLAQEDWQRQMQRYYPQASYSSPSYSSPADSYTGSSKPEGSKDSSGKDGKGKPEEKDKGKEKEKEKEEKDKGKEKEKNKTEKEEKKDEKKDELAKIIDDMKKLDKLLDSGTKIDDKIEVIKIENKSKSRLEESEEKLESESEGEEEEKKPEKIKVKFQDIAKSLKNLLNDDKSVNQDQLFLEMDEYIKKNKILPTISRSRIADTNSIYNYIVKLEKNKKLKFDPKLAEIWKNIELKHGEKIGMWYQNISNINKNTKINKDQEILYFGPEDQFEKVKDKYDETTIMRAEKFREASQMIKEIFEKFKKITEKVTVPKAKI